MVLKHKRLFLFLTAITIRLLLEMYAFLFICYQYKNGVLVKTFRDR